MHTFNMNTHVERPMVYSRGVNKDRTKIKPAEPAFELEPIEYVSGLGYQDERLMGYNEWGAFVPTVMARDARRFGAANMEDNLALLNAMNDLRRR